LSASRQRRQVNRRPSLNIDPNPSENIYNPPAETNTFYSGVDFRTTKEKIESLEKEIKERQDDSTVFIYIYLLRNNIFLLLL
jgi:hypothetical protein